MTVGDTYAAWKEQAVKLGGRDTMLQYRDSRDGSIDLTGAHPSGVAQLLTGNPTRLASLIRDHEQLADARRRARMIKQKADALSQERGLNTAHLAIGFATWSQVEDKTKTEFAAPVVLRHVRILPRGTRSEDFEVVLDDDITINPALVDHLSRHHGIEIDVDEWVAASGFSRAFDPAPVFARLRAVTKSVDGLVVNQRLVLSNFANLASALQADVLPEDHTVLRALAEDRAARASFGVVEPTPATPVRSAAKDSDAPASDAAAKTSRPLPAVVNPTPLVLDDRKPQEEFLALDANGDQQAVVDVAVAGQSLAIDTPPGTGALQVAASLATTLAHTGRSVLYVAQNADTLDGFLNRLASAGLGDFAVDGRRSPSGIQKHLVKLIVDAERAEKPQLADLLDKLNEHREVLIEHAESLHRERAPWNVSVYSTMQHLAELTAVPGGPSTSVRFTAAIMEISPASRVILRDKLLELSALGAFTLDVADTVWLGARLADNAEAEAARRVSTNLSSSIPKLAEKIEPLFAEAKLKPERTLDAWKEALELLGEVRGTLDKFVPDVFAHGLTDLIAATGSPEYRREANVDMGFFERGRLKKAAREFLRPGAHVEDLHTALIAAKDQRGRLKTLAGADIKPRIPSGLKETNELFAQVVTDVDKLSPVLEDTPDGGDLANMGIDELLARLGALSNDKESLRDLPARTKLDTELRDAGLGELIADLRARKVSHDLVGQEFDLAYWATVLQQIATQDPQVGDHDGPALHARATEYAMLDQSYVAAGSTRLRHSHAQRWSKAIASFPQESEAMKDALKQHVLHVDELSQAAPHVLPVLAPIWVMNPYQVPAYFPEAKYFDTVILADAERVSVAEAVPSIARAEQTIVIGDDRLLGPSDFSVAVARRTSTRSASALSVLHELRRFLPTYQLHATYRHSPAGLVDLLNTQFYDGAITAMPSAHTEAGTGITLSYVPDALGTPDPGTGQVESLDEEVARVVELVVKHARTQSRRSLAVITITPWHAKRIAQGIQAALREYPYIASFFSSNSSEPFVVTDAERAQGLSRDSVIFSLGYGRTRQGRIVHNFGELSKPGGERLLAASLTPARRHLTIVTCLEPGDFDQQRLRHGAALLPRVLEKAAHPGAPLLHPEASVDDPLVTDIADRLIRRGVTPEVHYGGVDLAVAVSSAEDLGFSVAVESDGPSYYAIPSIRERERLRPEALSRRGWNYRRLWATDAFVDPQREANEIHDAWRESVEDSYPQAVVAAERAAATFGERKLQRPHVVPGRAPGAYLDAELVDLLTWIQSDGFPRSDAALKEQLRMTLALRDRSAEVETRLNAAIALFRRGPYEDEELVGPGGDLSTHEVREATPESSVMPSYDTDKLRENELIDQGLRDPREDGTPVPGVRTGGSPAPVAEAPVVPEVVVPGSVKPEASTTTGAGSKDAGSVNGPESAEVVPTDAEAKNVDAKIAASRDAVPEVAADAGAKTDSVSGAKASDSKASDATSSASASSATEDASGEAHASNGKSSDAKHPVKGGVEGEAAAASAADDIDSDVTGRESTGESSTTSTGAQDAKANGTAESTDRDS